MDMHNAKWHIKTANMHFKLADQYRNAMEDELCMENLKYYFDHMRIAQRLARDDELRAITAKLIEPTRESVELQLAEMYQEGNMNHVLYR